MVGKVRVPLAQAEPKCGFTATSTPTWALVQSWEKGPVSGRGPDLVPGCHPNSKACPLLLLLTTTPPQPQLQLQPLRPPEPQWSWGSLPKLVLNSPG